MPVEYVCAVNRGHIESCGALQNPPPQCCGKPMVLARCAVKAAVAAQPAAAQQRKTSAQKH
jgi:hypothetical protein